MKVRKKRCKECKELFMPTYSTTQIACSPKCAYAYSKRRDKQTKEKNSVSLLNLDKQIKSRKRLPDALKQTQIVFNQWIRLRDTGKPCISSNNDWKFDFDAGHLFSVKQYSELRFDEDNVHGQSIQDNRFKEGNFESYIVNVRYRIGDDRLGDLLKRAEISKQRPHKWTLEELSIIRAKYKNKIKQW
jgi:hypothetical protein